MKNLLVLENEISQLEIDTIISYAQIKAKLSLEKLSLKSKLRELKGTVKPFNKIKYKKEVQEALTDHRLNLLEIKSNGKVANKILKKRHILITNEGKWYEAKKNNLLSFDKNFNDQKQNLKKECHQKIKNIKLKTEKCFLKLQYKINNYNLTKELSYQSEYLSSLYQFKLNYLQNKENLSKEGKAKILIAKQTFLKIKEEKNFYFQKYKNDKNILEKELQTKISNEKLSKTEIKFLKNKVRIQNKEIKYQNKFYLVKNNIAYEKHQLKKELKILSNTYTSEINNLKNNIPYECNRTRKYWVTVLGIIPGVGQIINKQIFKGLLIVFTVIPVISVFLLYSFGIGNIGGNGLFGLRNFGTGEDNWPDYNYYLIEGVISLILFTLVLIMLVLIVRDTLYGAIKLEKGSRLHNWSETRRYLQNEGFPYMLSIPALFLILFIVIVPVLSTILISFTNYGTGHIPPGNTYNWVGLENYKLIFSGPWGESFWNVLTWTVLWTIFATMGGLIAGACAAFLLANKRIKGQIFFRIVLILPWAIPAFITIMLFSILFGDNNIIDSITKNFGIQYWKRSELLTKIALIFVQSWLGQSYIFLLTTGVMQGISKDLYDAAKIDGASTFRQIIKITIPIIVIQIAPLLLGSFTFNFNNFAIIWLFNGGGPSPVVSTIGSPGTTDILLSFIFKLSTGTNNNAAMGAAFALLTSVFVIGVSSISFRNMKAFKN